jgi:hypothetical protein
MIGYKTNVIHERSNIISIPRKIYNHSRDINNNTITYDLNQNCFDPSKSSPPNDFMLKLKQRMNQYESLGMRDFNRERA